MHCESRCLAQEHNTMSPARARNQTSRSRDERTNHEATAPFTVVLVDLAVMGDCILKLSCYSHPLPNVGNVNALTTVLFTTF